MKNKSASFLLLSALIITLLSSPQCKKDVDELSKLPPITQEGKNTFGCLVNGKAWIPQGYDGVFPNIRVTVEPNSLDIRVYSYKDQVLNEILIGCTDFKGIGIYNFNNPTQQSFGYITSNCQILRNDTAYRTGNFRITKFDSDIISGTFECSLFLRNCGDTIRITHGRFDKKL